MVMGENPPADPATKSRYARIHVSRHSRIGDGAARYMRVMDECKHWFHLGRWLLEHRPAFAALAQEHLAAWKLSPSVQAKIADDRDRFVPGVAFACYYAAAELLGLTNGAPIMEFQSWLLTSAHEAAAEVSEQDNLGGFWSDIITYRQNGKIDRKYFRLKWVVAEPDGTLRHVADGSLIHRPAANAIRVCYIAFRNVYDQYQRHKRELGELPKLTIAGIRDELKRKTYNLPNPKRKNTTTHKTKMGETAGMVCWVVSLERRPDAGVPDEEDRPYLHPFAEELIEMAREADPET